jgi:hypothetical protein
VSHDDSVEFLDDKVGCQTLYRLKDYDSATATFIDIAKNYPADKKFTVPTEIQDTVQCAFYTVVGIATFDEDVNSQPYKHPAFSGNDWITEVNFVEPSLVTEIGDDSFKNSTISKVLLPKSLQTIGKNVFEGSALTVLSLPPSVKGIGESAFAAPGLTKIVFRGQVPPALETGAFSGLPAAGVVYYPEGANYSAVAAQLTSEAGSNWSAGTYTDLNTVYEYAAEDNDLKIIKGVIPTISGDAKVGKTLTANPGNWDPADVAFSYQWYADGSAVANAVNSTYTVTKAEIGKTITIRVTGSKSGYIDNTKTSVATGKVTEDSKSDDKDATDKDAADQKTTDTSKAATGKTAQNKVKATVPKASAATIKAGNKKVTITIKKVTGATKYTIRFKVNGAKKWSKSVSSKSPKLTLKKLKTGKKYQIQYKYTKKVGTKSVSTKWSKTITTNKIKK